MRRIDELFTAWPFSAGGGWRRVAAMLQGQVHAVNRKRARRLMRKMGMAELGPKPRTTRPAPGHEILPYLLRGLAIERPNQVWCADIAYIPIGRGFLYVVAINGLGEPGGAVVAAVQHDGRLVRRRRARGGARALWPPELFNTDQGSQFTSAGFTGKLMAARVRISMDGRGRWIKGLGARERIEICAEVSVVDSGRQFPAPLPGQRLRH
jgi:putative transposase